MFFQQFTQSISDLFRHPLPPKKGQEIFRLMNQIEQCGVLQYKKEYYAASKIVKWLGLPYHHDRQKNWDSLKTLYYILSEIHDLQSPILDAASGYHSAILRWLALLGYKNLFACDIRESRPFQYKLRNINFSVQDIIQTNYPDGFFQGVTCISVIEHNIQLDLFLQEMARILQSGGLLLLSTDYWSEPVDCSGIYPYGKEMGEMKIFTQDEIEIFVNMAEDKGFSLCTTLNLDTKERVIRWERVNREYTFLFMAFRKM